MSAVFLTLLGGFGLLLFGIKTMSEALQTLVGDRLRSWIGRARSGALQGFAAGVAVSAVSQSSSATTVMLVRSVNAGLMTLRQAASVTLGANVGATAVGWLLALRLQQSAVALIGLGAVATLFARRDALKYSGELALGVGFLFVGLGWLESGCAALQHDGTAVHYLGLLGSGGVANLVLTVLLGAALTVFVQSATALVALTMAVATVGLISFAAAAALVLGANLGATMTAQRAAAEATTDSRRTALFHALANALGVIVVVCIFPIWISVLDAILPGNPGAFDAAGIHPSMAAHVALAHTAFNVLMAAIALPLLHPLVRLAERLVGPAARERRELKFLRQTMVESPALAIEQCRLEVLHMATIGGEALHVADELLSDAGNPQTELRTQIVKRERATDAMQHAITVFMSRVMAGPLTQTQSEEIRGLIRAADEIERVADYCERLANYRRRFLREGIVLSDAARQELTGYLDRTIAFYEEIVDRVRRGEKDWLAAIHTKAQYLTTEADGLRDANLQRLASQRASPGEGIYYNDLLVAIRRIRGHALNMAEAFLGKK